MTPVKLKVSNLSVQCRAGREVWSDWFKVNAESWLKYAHSNISVIFGHGFIKDVLTPTTSYAPSLNAIVMQTLSRLQHINKFESLISEVNFQRPPDISPMTMVRTWSKWLIYSLFPSNTEVISPPTRTTTGLTSASRAHIWHRHLTHASVWALLKILSLGILNENIDCEPCILSKQYKQPFRIAEQVNPPSIKVVSLLHQRLPQ